MKNLKLQLRAVDAARGVDPDPERALLPALITMYVQDNGTHVRLVTLGWWRWGVGVAITWTT